MIPDHVSAKPQKIEAIAKDLESWSNIFQNCTQQQHANGKKTYGNIST
jgi:hypothetical protein